MPRIDCQFYIGTWIIENEKQWHELLQHLQSRCVYADLESGLFLSLRRADSGYKRQTRSHLVSPVEIPLRKGVALRS